MNERDIFKASNVSNVNIFILYIKNNQIITMDKDKLWLDRSTCSVTPSAIHQVSLAHNIIDGMVYDLDEVISYNNTYDINRNPDITDIVYKHDGLSPIIFNPTSRFLSSLNCLVFIMKCREDKIKSVNHKTRKKQLYVVK